MSAAGGDSNHARDAPSPLRIGAYRVNEENDGSLEAVSLKQALEGQKQTQEQEPPQQQQEPPEQYWIDVEVQGPMDAALPLLRETILDRLDLLASATFLRTLLQDASQWQTPQVLHFRNAALIVTRILDVLHGSVRHVATLCLRHMIVTVTSSRNRATSSSCSSSQQQLLQFSEPLDETTTTIGATQHDTLKHMLEFDLIEATVSGCVLLCLTFHVQRTTLCANRLRNDLYGLAERDIATVDWSEIAECKNAMLHFAEVSEEQNECVQAVTEGNAVTESLSFDTSLALRGTVNCLKQAAATTERLVYRMEKHLADIENAYDANQQKRINHRLNALTIISAIFMPLTLIVGIYGQNFVNIPELEYENAYFIELGCMGALFLTMLLFFYKNGWLS